MKEIEPLCECGCGEYVNPGRKFVIGHHLRGRGRTEKFRDFMKGNKYALGKIRKRRPIQLCECGCDEYAEPGKRFIMGHNSRLEEARKKLRESRLGKPPAFFGRKMPAISVKISGANNPNWIDGRSLEPYGSDWTNELKAGIKKRDNYRCQLCYRTRNDDGIVLCVHHIDYDKKNNDPYNLVALCKACNSRVNTNRGEWERFFNLIVKSFKR